MTKVFKHQLSLEHFQTIKRILAPDWTQKTLCIIVPNQRTVSREFFSWVHTRQLLTQLWLVWFMHQRNANSPFQNIVYPKTKDTFQKYKLELTIGIHACIDHAFVNIREFKITQQLTATSHEKWIHIFSVSIMIIPTRLLCQMQANSSGAEFLSTISKFMKRMNFVIACLRPSQNVKLGIFTW